MESLIYPGRWTLTNRKGHSFQNGFVNFSAENDVNQRNLSNRGIVHDVIRGEQLIYVPEPRQSSSPTAGEMNLTEIPVVDNSFSLPQNVFERALASQTPVSITTSSSAGFASPFMNNPAASAAPGANTGRAQRRRTSGELCIAEFTGSKAKRRRFSSPTSVEMFALRMEDRNRKRELVKQQILERIDRTKDNIVKLLKMQQMQEFLHYYEKSWEGSSFNQTENPANSQRNEPQYHSTTGSAYERQYSTPLSAPTENDPRSGTIIPNRNDMQGAAHHVNRRSHSLASTQRLRHVPGINVVMDGTQKNKQNTSYSCKSCNSVGLAWDHHTLPKIVAVHSVIKDASVNTTKSKRSPPHEPATAVQIPSSYSTSGAPDCSQTSQQTQMRASVIHRDVTRGTVVASTDHSDSEVVVTKVLPGKVRRSRSKNLEQVDHSEPVDYMSQSHHPGDAFRSSHVGQMENGNHPGLEDRKHLYHPGPHAGLAEEARTDCSVASPFQTASGERPSRVHRDRVDSQIYLGGPPPYLPLLDSSELAEQEKQTTLPPESRERRGSSPASPKLAKTIPEISAKIIDTRERMKNETIDWKKKILYKLENRLIRKLRRVERETGEKTEIEDLREEAPAEESKKERKKRRSQSFDRRNSGTDSVTDDDEDDVARGSKAVENLHEEEKGGKLGDIQEDPSLDKQHEEEEKRPSPNNQEEENDVLMDNDNNNSSDLLAEKSRDRQFTALTTDVEKTEPLKLSTKTIMDKKVEESSKNLCNSLTELLIVDEMKEKSTSGESTDKVDCVTNELSQETKFSSDAERINAKETFDAVNTGVKQSCKTENNTSTELSEINHDQKKLPQDFQTKEDRVSTKSNTDKEIEVKTENLFEVFSSGSQTSHIVEKTHPLPETTQKATAPISGGDKSRAPAETTKTQERDTKVLTNVKSLKKRLQTASKEIRKKKAETASCERNIWSVLQKHGVF